MKIDRHKPGAFCWFELATTDQLSAKQFYQSLFGWEASDLPISAGEVYTMFKVDGRDVGVPPPEFGNPHAPPHWLIYVQVSDCAAVTSKAQGLGAQVHVNTMGIGEEGWFSVLQDPQGAVFALHQRRAQAS